MVKKHGPGSKGEQAHDGERPKTRRSPRSPKRAVLSAGIIPVFLAEDADEPYYLLLRVYNYWDFPKGLVERGEEPLMGARRELREETTLERVELPWGEDYRETEPYSYGKIARYYLGRVGTRDVSLPIQPALGRPEHHEFRWVPFAEAVRLVSPRVRPILEWAHGRVTGQI